MTNLEIEIPEIYFETMKSKTTRLFEKIKTALKKAEEKILETISRLAETIRKYWKFLILPARILILVLKKMKEQGYWNCEKN